MERSIINPDEIFVEGCDYHVPVACGLMPQDYIQDIKNDATFNEADFAQEYLSIFTGGSAESWILPSKLTRLRTIVNPEVKANKRGNNFYIIAVDVARSGEAKTAISILNVVPNDNGPWMKKLVNLFIVKGDELHFQDQANIIKQLIEDFDPKEVIIDGTGLGRGLLDFMVIETIDSHGKIYPAYASYNDDELKKVQPPNAPKIINALILGGGTLASEIHSICYNECMNGHVRLLIEEKDAKARLMATKKGQNMPINKRVERLLPYEMTTRLIEEMGNLRIKSSLASKNIMLERMNTEIQKDRFSSFEYAIYSAKKIEEVNAKKNRRKGISLSSFFMKN